MRLTKFPVLLVLLTARACRGNIILETSRPNESTSNLLEDLVNIVTSCYGDRIEGVGLAGNLPDTLIRTLMVRHLIPVGLIGNTYRFGDKREIVPVQFRHKMNVFIVEASSVEQLDRLIQKNIEYSRWWNHMASFIILDISQECDYTYDYLYLSWQNNILNAIAMCNNRENGTIIFNYNPFTSQAPISWQQFKVFPARNKHPFTIFSRPHRANETIYTDLNFEKTKNLGGYLIRIYGEEAPFIRTKLHRYAYHFRRRIERVIDGFDTLNATVTYTNDYEDRFLTNAEMHKRTVWLSYKWSEELITYPHERVGIIIISHFRGHKSQLNKILSVIDETSRFGVAVVYLITFIFFKLFVGQALVPSLLNLIRMTCNTGFAILPGNTATRIYLACLLFFVITIQGIHQGLLASLLTTNIPLQNIHTLQDLVDYGYEVCVQEGIDRVIDDPVLQQKCIYNTSQDCIMKVVHDPLTAYVGFAQGTALDLADELDLHISKEITADYIGFKIRWYWPLEEAVNTMIQKFVEADVIDPWDMQCDPMKLTDFQYDAAVKSNQDFKIMELRDLSFAFVILAIGLSCATIVFIIELAIQYRVRCECEVWIERRYI